MVGIVKQSKENKYKFRGVISKYTSELTGYMSILEIHSNNELFVNGCNGVLEYESSQVILDTISGRLVISGDNLSLDVFQGETLNISGKIHKVNLEDYD